MEINRPLHLLIDSTGIKVEGEGEWNARKHGGAKRRVWRKIHLGIDEQTLEVRAIEVTKSDIGDAPMLPELLGQIAPRHEVASVTADGGRVRPEREPGSKGWQSSGSADGRVSHPLASALPCCRRSPQHFAGNRAQDTDRKMRAYRRLRQRGQRIKNALALARRQLDLRAVAGFRDQPALHGQNHDLPLTLNGHAYPHPRPRGSRRGVP